MTKSINPEENEIDLLELFGAIWSHKFLIVLFTALSILLSGHYALTTEKRFTARAIFKIEEISSGSSFNISDELGALASLAGFGGVGKTSSSEVLLERAIGREFILNMKEKYSLEERFSYRNFNLKQVFDTIDFSNYKKAEVESYYPIDCWEGYCNFLSKNNTIKKPSVLVYSEWNELGVDHE